ncbi:MAG: type II secretion system protein [Clostridia bacterium]|nr:type II secretion system protein [Clostridia bacterium]
MRNNMKENFFNEKGLTLMEVLIAIVLLSLIAMTFLNVFMSAFDNSIKAQEITNYTYSAQGVMEELRTMDFLSLVSASMNQDGNMPFDINGDGTDDCYMHFKVSPYGIMNEKGNGKQGSFVYMVYVGDKILAVDNDGNIIYTSATVNPTIVLYMQPGGTQCYLTINGKTIYFDRPGPDRDVYMFANLNYKDYGYTNTVDVLGSVGHAYIKAYGNEAIVDDLSVKGPQGHIENLFGLQNNFSLLTKITVELFHEEDDTTPFYDLFDIFEVTIGDLDSLE